ncbi:substrate-binding periplasmic protein [Spartinivicinus ruber]|uniref:substrate-binding periplasmic protein n=1 Tax=Spartinivicinus ruber TaxID=2683272 RepID=UPI0013CFB8F3|nr:transporter substrate-binding domain-containing protein [Spartinivicinus ruber]
MSATISAKDITVVRGNGSYPPNEMVVDNVLTGFHIDLVEIIAKRLGYNCKFRSLPWKRALEMVKQGTAEAITYSVKNKVREKYLYFLKGNILSTVENRFFILKKQLNSIVYSGEYRSLVPYRIGVLIAYSYESEFNKADYLKKIYVKKAESQLIKMLVNNRFDIAVGDFTRIKYLATQSGDINKIAFLEPPISKNDVYIAFSKLAASARLAKQFSDEMLIFKKTHTYKELRNKYGL